MTRKIFPILIAILLCVTPAFGATYCISDDGTAGSKTAATDCSDMSKCMNEADHNGESFSDDDIILVCPNDGPFQSVVTPPTSGSGSGNEITYRGVYSAVYGWPVFDEGINLSADWLIVTGVESRGGAAAAATKTFEGGRFADTSRSWQAAEETPVTNWSSADVGIFAVGIGSSGGAVGNVTPQLYFRDKTDAGSFAAVGAATEVRYSAATGLTDDGNVDDDSPGPSEFGTSSGKTQVTGLGCEQEDSHQASSATSLSDNEYTELQVGVSFVGADQNHEYEFALYESGSQVGSASAATVTVLDKFCTNFTSPPNLVCEDLSGSNSITDTDITSAAVGSNSEWTAVISSGNTIDEVNHENSWGCVDAGQYAMKYTVAAANGENAYLKHALSSPESTVKAEMCFSVTSSGLTVAERRIGLLHFVYQDDLTTMVYIAARFVSGTSWEIYGRRWETSGTNSFYGGSFSLDQPVCVSVEWTNATLVRVKLDADQDGTYETTVLSDTTLIYDRDVSYIYFGSDAVATYHETGKTVTIEADLLGIDDTSLPGVCQ